MLHKAQVKHQMRNKNDANNNETTL